MGGGRETDRHTDGVEAEIEAEAENGEFRNTSITWNERANPYLTTTILSINGAAVANALTPGSGTARPTRHDPNY